MLDPVRLADISAEIIAHPGHGEHMALIGFGQTIDAVFVRNWQELTGTLDAPNHNLQLAVELFQNVHRPDVRDQYFALVAQRLHNYVSASMTLVDHARTLMCERTGEIECEFGVRYRAVAAEPESAFIQGLRNFTLHRSLPVTAHSITFKNMEAPTIESDVRLVSSDLLAADCWNATARKYIERDDKVSLAPVIAKHGPLMIELHAWLRMALGQANAHALAEVNELIVKRNALMFGVDLAAAREATDRITAMRSQPEAPADFPSIFDGITNRRNSG